MPWRAEKGKKPNPYHVWLSEIMLQQTTVAAVGPYFNKFIKKWPTVHALAEAGQDEVLAAWAGLGYYARARNLHKCAKAIVRDFGGKFPETEEELLELPGVGPYTAAAISSIAFNRFAVAVDGNVERVASRYFAVKEPLPASKDVLRKKAMKIACNNLSPSDFTQAFMELGATVCTPRNPKCGGCPWAASCAAKKLGIAESLPHKLKKKTKPVRYGRVYWTMRPDGTFLIGKRPGKGLYAGMYQLPTTEWLEKKSGLPKGRGKPLGLEVRHSFTHFDLVLEIWSAPPAGRGGKWILPRDMEDYALPSLMQKVIRLCLDKARFDDRIAA
jgi:A/G-specific adenine glycosylase